MQVSPNAAAAFTTPTDTPAPEAPATESQQAAALAQAQTGGGLRELNQTQVPVQIASQADVNSGSDTVSPEPMNWARKDNSSNGRGSQGGDSQGQQSNPGPRNETLSNLMAQKASAPVERASGAVLGPSKTPFVGTAVVGPSKPQVDPGPLVVTRIPGPGDIGYKAPSGAVVGPSRPAGPTPNPSQSSAVVGPSKPQADPGPLVITRIPGPGDIGYKAPSGAVVGPSRPASPAPSPSQGGAVVGPSKPQADPGPLVVTRIPGPGDIGYKAPPPSSSAPNSSAPPGAVAKFDGEWLDKDGNMIPQPGRIGIIRHPQPGEENYALFKQLTDPHGTRDKPTQAPVPMPKQPGHFEAVLKPLQVPDAQAVAPVQGAQAVAPIQGAGSASQVEVQGLEMMLADPDTQAMVAQYGGELKPVPQDTKVGQAIVKRYGDDLGARLYQLQTAQRAVEAEYSKALSDAMRNPGPGVPGAVFVEGSSFLTKTEEMVPPHWTVSMVSFTKAYAQGDSPGQKAFLKLHGADPLKFVPDRNPDNPGAWMLNGREFQPPKTGSFLENPRPELWFQGSLSTNAEQLDPARITKLHNTDLVWFDPQQGFVTHPENLKGGIADKIVLGAMLVAATAMGGYAAAGLMGAGTAGAGVMAGAVNSIITQGMTTGDISLGGVFRAAITGGLSASGGLDSFLQSSGLQDMAQSADWGDKVLGTLGTAAANGAARYATGGKFVDGFVGSALKGVGSQIKAELDLQIDAMKGLNPMEESSLRLLASSVGSAVDLANGSAGEKLKKQALEYLKQVYAMTQGKS